MNLLRLVILTFSFLALSAYAVLTSSIDPKSSSRENLAVKDYSLHNQKIIPKNLFIRGNHFEKFALKEPLRILESQDDHPKRVSPGFWENPSQTHTYYCFNNPESCLGERDCQEGYSGTLCNECLPQYSNLLKNQCNECGFRSIFAILHELFLIISPVLITWCILMIIMDSRNSLDIGRGDSTKRQKLCMLVNNIIIYLQDLYLLSIVVPNLPTSLLYLSQPIANSSFSLFGLMNCFSNENSGVALRYIVSFGINFALILILMKISFSWWFIKKNTSIIFLCVFLLQNLGLVDFALSLLSCQEVEGENFSIYNMSIECEETSLTRNIVLLSTFIFSVIIAPWMIIQGVLKRQIRNEEAQTRIKITLFGTEEELQAQSDLNSSWLFVYFNNFGKLILLFASIMLKSTPTRSPINFVADVAFVFYYLGFLLLNLKKRNIAFLKSWQSRLVLMRPGIILLTFLIGEFLLSPDWPFINSGVKWIVSLLHLAYIVFLGTVTVKETWKKVEVFNFASKEKNKIELEKFFHHHPVQLVENKEEEDDDDDGFGEFQSEDTHDETKVKKEEEHLHSDDSEEPEFNDEMIAKEEMRGLCDDEEDQD